MVKKKSKKNRIKLIDVRPIKKKKTNKIDFMRPVKRAPIGTANLFGVNTPKRSAVRSKKIFQIGAIQPTRKSNWFMPAPYNPIKPIQLSPFKISTKGIRRKDMRWIQTLGNPKYKNLNPFRDEDGDGVLNSLDCRPFDPTRQEDINVGAPSIVPPEFRKKKKKKKLVKELSEEEFNKAETKRLINKKIDADIAREKEKALGIEEATGGFLDRQIKKAREQALDTELQNREFIEKKTREAKETIRETDWQSDAFENRQKEKISDIKDKKKKRQARIDAEKRKYKKEITLGRLSVAEARELKKGQKEKRLGAEAEAKAEIMRQRNAIRLAGLESRGQRALLGT